MRRIVERLLPWYDPEQAAQRDREATEVRRRSIASRIRAEDAMAEAHGTLAAYRRVHRP